MSTLTLGTIQSNTTAPPAITNSGGTEIGTFCRAWVNFNGTGTVAIRASFNVSSITDNGVGDYTVNFTTAMPDVNYAVSGCGGPDVATGTAANGTLISPFSQRATPYLSLPSVSSFRFTTPTAPNNFATATDTAFIHISVFR